MTNLIPGDQSERDRLREDLDRTLYVVAGAGTGKTTALVGRIVALVAAGLVELERLAAITFTEAAASELRQRVRQRLEAAAHDPDRSEQAQARCARAATQVDLAAIQTIHAFAGALLRMFPIEAGLPPGFDVWDDFQSSLAFEERFRSWLYDDVPTDRPEGRERREAIRRALVLGMTFDHLRALGETLEEHLDRLTMATWTPEPTPNALKIAHRLGAELVTLPAFIPFAKLGEADPLVKLIRRLQLPATRMIEARDETDALAAMVSIGSIPGKVGAQKNWIADSQRQNPVLTIRDVLKPVSEEITSALESHRMAALVAVLECLREFTLDNARHRRQIGAATFHDLLTWARDLLRDNHEVCAQASKRYDRIFVDEFQDTDPLQAEIIWRLGGETASSPSTDWRDITLRPGKVFVVGDPKQSIYRFRRADVGLYHQIYDRASPEERASLTQNFRSVPAVIDWVNHHFRLEMQPASDAPPGAQAIYEDLLPIATTSGSTDPIGKVYTMGGPVDGNAAAVRENEAEAVARAAQQIVHDGWLIREPSGETRPARYADICVLFPTRTNARGLEDAFEKHEVPYRIESGSLVLATQEVRDLLACLRAIDDPSDQVALVTALRSPAYACSDVDLLTWIEQGGTLDYEVERPDLVGPVASAFASLRRLHDLRTERSVAATVEALIRERMLAIQSFAQLRPREAWRRLRYVVAQARRLAAAGHASLRALVNWLEDLQRAQVRDVESPLPEVDEDAVRLLTIHGAKGLEFPIVILTGLGVPPADHHDGPRVLTSTVSHAIEVGFSAFKTTGFDGAKERDKHLDEAERVRLHYVAATRARDFLILCVFRKMKADKSPAGRIAENLTRSDASSCPELDLAPAPSASAPSETDAAPVSESPEEHARAERRWLEERQALIAERRAFPIIAASSLSHGMATPNGAVQSVPLDLPESRDAGPTQEALDMAPLDDDEEPPIDLDLWPTYSTGGSPSAVGQAVHEALASLGEWNSEYDERLAAIARAHGIADRVEGVRQLVEAAWKSPPNLRALASQRSWREVSVGVELDGVLLHGRIDLVYERADGTLAIVDFKTDRVTQSRAAERGRAYFPQEGAYALALERVTGKNVGAIEIVFAALRGHYESVPDVPFLVAQVRAMIQSRMTDRVTPASNVAEE